jgi:hypothetical protein
MSAIVRSLTPFLNQEQLLEALESLECQCTVQQDQITVTGGLNLRLYNKPVFKRTIDGKFMLLHERSPEIKKFLKQLEGAYIKAGKEYKRKLQELKILAEQEEVLSKQREIELKKQELEQKEKERELAKQAYVQQQKAEIIRKAKEQGYEVKEYKKGNNIQLQLVKVTY